MVLGSRSTYTRAGIGGWRGRALQAGDELPVSTQPREVAEHWWLDRRILPAYEMVPKVRVGGFQSFQPNHAERRMQTGI